MTRAMAQVVLPHPLPDVFRFVAVDFFRYREQWARGVERMNPMARRRMGPGLIGSAVRVLPTGLIEMDLAVTVWDPPTAFELVESRGDIAIRTSYGLLPAGDGTEVLCVRDASLPGLRYRLPVWSRRALERELRAELDRLAAMLDH